MKSSAVEIIFGWDSEETQDKMIFHGDRQEVERYLQAVDEIQRSDDYDVIQIAMSRLQLEFRNILISHTNYPFPSHRLYRIIEEGKQEWKIRWPRAWLFALNRFGATSSPKRHVDELLRFASISFNEIRAVPSYAVNDLRRIAERMISSGYLCQCIDVYASIRKSVFDVAFQRLEIDDSRLGQLDLNAKIHCWIKAAEVCFRTMFSNEKKLCEQIFNGVETFISDACFMETAKAPAIQLLNFVDTTCTTLTSSPDNLFKILELHRALESLMPQIHLLFRSESVRVVAAEVLSRLAEAARETLSQFENNVLIDSSKGVSDGAVHPLTKYVMKYISLISEYYKVSLSKLIVSKPSSILDNKDLDFVEEEEWISFLDMHLVWIIEILQFKLVDKSRQYKKESLSHMFIMNNVHYIFKWLRRPSCVDFEEPYLDPRQALPRYLLRDIVGDAYLKKLTRKFKKAAIGYKKTTRGKNSWPELFCQQCFDMHILEFAKLVGANRYSYAWEKVGNNDLLQSKSNKQIKNLKFMVEN
ncbi:hypothetical protein RJT34_11150 [Clitoria ternatea]|uniref:Exocyst subunit Exo70 family protein n=1 Tax=Clitoria ternatea TaxID=43366 RepID=A0AAN9JLY5_CLITE